MAGLHEVVMAQAYRLLDSACAPYVMHFHAVEAWLFNATQSCCSS